MSKPMLSHPAPDQRSHPAPKRPARPRAVRTERAPREIDLAFERIRVRGEEIDAILSGIKSRLA